MQSVRASVEPSRGILIRPWRSGVHRHLLKANAMSHATPNASYINCILRTRRAATTLVAITGSGLTSIDQVRNRANSIKGNTGTGLETA